MQPAGPEARVVGASHSSSRSRVPALLPVSRRLLHSLLQVDCQATLQVVLEGLEVLAVLVVPAGKEFLTPLP